MSTNPNNAVGTNGAFGGRTSVNAFNDVLGVFKSRGIVSGWGIVPDSGMDVAVGGDGSTRDVAIAEDNIGNKTTVNNISQQPVTVSIPAAPAANSRIDLIVAYVDNPAQGVATETDNYGACGLIVVSGASAANPVAPDETAIRTAITTDGGAGSVAYYVVLGSVTVASGTTDISSNMISAGAFAAVKSDNVDWMDLIKWQTIQNSYNLDIRYANLSGIAFISIYNRAELNITVDGGTTLTVASLPAGLRPYALSANAPAIMFDGNYQLINNSLSIAFTAAGSINIYNSSASDLNIRRLSAVAMFPTSQ